MKRWLNEAVVLALLKDVASIAFCMKVFQEFASILPRFLLVWMSNLCIVLFNLKFWTFG